MADYHALVKCDDPARVEESRLALAATWLAAGLDPERVVFYRQSDIPEIPELNWLLTCITPKGMMNRAHAYKAATDANAGGEPDDGINMGLFCYPVLMAADILMFNAHQVPVGKDQVQHIEMARDIAQRFNHMFGRGQALFTLPEAVTEEAMQLLPGLDGRKMSKSYDNAIPLFDGGAKALSAAIARVVTDSKLPGEPKDPDGSHLVTLYDAFASVDERAAFRAELRAGLGWGEAKKRLHDVIDREIGPMRAKYEAFMARPELIEEQLLIGARRRRAPSPRRSCRRCASPSACAVSVRWPPRPSPHRRRPAPRWPRSSSIARRMASSISSWWARATRCCCRARPSPAAATPGRGWRASGRKAPRRSPARR